jgi:hypothetical protein
MAISLINQSKSFKKEADLLLRKSKILRLLEPSGQVRLTGSYKLGLMLNGDIDIHIINPKITKNSVIRVLNKLIKQGFFNGYLFFDWIKFRKAEFPKGYYIGLKTKFNQKKWKIDIWFIQKDDNKEIKLMGLVEKKNLGRKNKLTILKFKGIRNRKNLEIPSSKIYQAVIEKGITRQQEFLKFVKQDKKII